MAKAVAETGKDACTCTVVLCHPLAIFRCFWHTKMRSLAAARTAPSLSGAVFQPHGKGTQRCVRKRLEILDVGPEGSRTKMQWAHTQGWGKSPEWRVTGPLLKLVFVDSSHPWCTRKESNT